MTLTPAIAAWDARIADLYSATVRLRQATQASQAALVDVRRVAVEQALQAAIVAARTVAGSGEPVPADVQGKWVSALTQMESALNDAKALVHRSSGAGDVVGPVTGLKLPFVQVVVPWPAVIGIVAIAGTAWWLSRRKRK